LAMPKSFDYLIEPFAGSSAFSLAMIDERFIDASKVWLNDKNPACMAFYETLRDYPERLRTDLMDICEYHGIGDETLFLKAYAEIKEPSGDTYKLALAQYIVNRLGFGGKAVNRNSYCNPFKSGHGLRPAIIQDLQRFSVMLKGTKQSCGDYRKIEPLSSNSLIYYDPPYGEKMDWDSYGKGFEVEQKDFVEHCESFRDRCHLLISYGDTLEAIEAFAGWNVFRVPVNRPSSKEVNQTELVITNYEIPYKDMLCDEWELAA